LNGDNRQDAIVIFSNINLVWSYDEFVIKADQGLGSGGITFATVLNGNSGPQILKFFPPYYFGNILYDNGYGLRAAFASAEISGNSLKLGVKNVFRTGPNTDPNQLLNLLVFFDIIGSDIQFNHIEVEGLG